MADQEHQYNFNVSMSCGGCSGAVERVLKKLDGNYPELCPSAPPQQTPMRGATLPPQ